MEVVEKSCCAPTCCAVDDVAVVAVDDVAVIQSTEEESIKEMVREKYAEIALNGDTGCGCGTDCCGAVNVIADEKIMAESYENLEGYVPEADLGLGCGLPTEFAQINEGDVVVDLGSGAGNDAFIARRIVGENGKVFGVDMTQAMIDLAQKNAHKLGYANVEFVLGEIENMPLLDNLADVVVSNCVMNLVPNKTKAFAETYRILKHGGHFSISDIVLEGELTPRVQQLAELYAGCVSGAMQKQDYLRTIQEAGFTDIVIQKDRKITLPDELLHQHLTDEEFEAFKASQIGIFSLTVYAEKR
jgi:ubiquinone/menaquinone biosynthesis C-methylase UbiE